MLGVALDAERCVAREMTTNVEALRRLRGLVDEITEVRMGDARKDAFAKCACEYAVAVCRMYASFIR